MGRTGNRPVHQAQFAMVYGYCAHAHATARAYLLATESAPILVAPLVRACYELALTTHWVAQADDGYRAVSNEAIRTRRAMADSLRKSTSEVFQEAGEDLPHTDLASRLESASDASARNLEQLCNDLEPGGADAYAIYRALSMESHPSVLIADQWLDPPPGLDSLGTLRVQPVQAPSEDVWTHLVAASLVWSGRALDYFDKAKVRPSFLRSMARELGIRDSLHLSQQYRERVARSKREAGVDSGELGRGSSGQKG